MTATQTQTETRTSWHLTGKGYEFCNCNPGCSCNFSGFPTSADGSCKAVVGNVIDSGHCGDVDLSGVTAVAIIDWPKAIHDGGGKVVFVVPPEVSEEQVGALAQIYTGALGGQPWEILGTTYEVAGLVRTPVQITADGLDVTMSIDGVGEATGRYFANPVTGERHEAQIVLPDGFIWREGQCGVGDFSASAEGLSLSFTNSNWILYDFDWSN
ncbi:MAG TPA: DUF1326 domain-containing protein [Jatrophihabitantaceae bacterium]|nr:DUF1326 domain-containing protein [Jatrophihabitantaceae bacterium]